MNVEVPDGAANMGETAGAGYAVGVPPVAESPEADSGIQRLGEIRARIDNIDAQIVALWNERAGLGLEADEIKEELGHDVLNGLRESEVLDNVIGSNEGPLPNVFFVGQHTEGMRETRTLQRKARQQRAADKLAGLASDEVEIG